MITVLLALIAASYALTDVEYHEAFFNWQQEHGKVYKSFLESRHRFAVFRYNLDFIMSHDAEATGFTVGLNEFADQTLQEFTSWACGLNITVEPFNGLNQVAINPAAPTSWDWRSHGAVTPVKNQGQCGSCWSFSATGSIEGIHFIKQHRLVSLSEQNLIDCSTRYGNQGCNGGLMDSAFRYVIANHGVDTEASYPYTATGPNACRFKAADVGATITGFHDNPRGSEAALLNAVYQQPVSVAIDASHQSFQFYKNGVYNEPACSSTQLDHGVLAVGYGDLNGVAYWLVKNSWGASWGQAGYIFMSRNRNNQCGIATMSSYPEDA
jgi:cathepsin L